tara:strand:+ start:711623 stop:712045 length:423 start_codon:yes stop_codon:yes gene_type:complete
MFVSGFASGFLPNQVYIKVWVGLGSSGGSLNLFLIVTTGIRSRNYHLFGLAYTQVKWMFDVHNKFTILGGSMNAQHATGVAIMTTANQIISESNESENNNRFMQILLIAAIAASSLSMIFSIGTAVVSASAQPVASAVSE